MTKVVRMARTKRKERLSEYVKRVMTDKNLTQYDIEHRSGDRISQSYVSQIINGREPNLGIDKLAALANGLDVPIEEILSVVSDRAA